jgi:hypothetical protein
MLLIYLSKPTERSKFIFKHIFKVQLGIPYSVTSDQDEFIAHKNEKICYNIERFSDCFFIKASGLLTDDSLKVWNINAGKLNGNHILFSNNTCDLGFDIFSASFYLLSRYEEYQPFKEDKSGRFPATESIAYKYGFLNIPIVDHWIQDFGRILLNKFPSLTVKINSFDAILTYDIDVAYQYKGRSFWRNTGATIKDILKFDFGNIKRRLQVIIQNQTDPWDVYDHLLMTSRSSGFGSIFFFLLGNKSAHDRNLYFKSRVMKSLILKVKQHTQVGIHPSLMSHKNIGLLAMEKERLEAIIQEKVTKSRQHYLKIRFPETYQHLISVGITEDYSMGFPEKPGFRAGTCFSFYFYDLKNEKITNLKIYPVCVMEATFKYYLKLNPEQTLDEIIGIIDEVKKVGGTFIPIWHNDNLAKTLSGNCWRDCHDKMIDYLKNNQKTDT